MDAKIIEKYLDYITDIVNDYSYFDVDCFFEDNNISEEDQEKIFEI